MKKILKRFLLLTFVFSIVNGTFPVYASDNEDVKNFEEAIKGDAFKFETNVESYNNDNLEIIGRYTEDLDDECYLEVVDATDMPSVVICSMVRRVEKARHCYVRRKSDKKVMVQFSLHGLFGYDGTRSACTDTKLNVYNNAPSKYAILRETHDKAGIWAKAECIVRNKKTGARLGRAFRIGVKPDGTVIKPPMKRI